jgi:hypothetical protein
VKVCFIGLLLYIPVQVNVAASCCGCKLLWLQVAVAASYCGCKLLWLQVTVAASYCGYKLLWLQVTVAASYCFKSISPHVHCAVFRPETHSSLLHPQRGDKDGEAIFI